MLEEHYSGRNSEAFWELIHVADDDAGNLCALGVQLQNLEGKVLKALNKRLSLIEKLKWEYDETFKKK
ncbi:MAG: hypothetical protein ACWGNI_00460 [Desulfobacterales bacterium]